MARYIDANNLKNRLLEERDKIPLTVIGRYSFGTPVASTAGTAMRGGIRKALRCMEQTPTADVVPRAEVKELRELLDATIAGQETLQLALANARSEVAREIFDEIYEDCFDQFGYINYEALAELKKKYKEDQT